MPFPTPFAPASWATPHPPGSPPDSCAAGAAGRHGRARAGGTPLSALSPAARRLVSLAREVMLGAVIGICGGWVAAWIALWLTG